MLSYALTPRTQRSTSVLRQRGVKNVDTAFEVHKLNATGIEKAKTIAKLFDELLATLSDECRAEGREFALVRTKLEEACFFAKKAMAKNPLNQEKQ
jgi:hypothetical protein